MELISLKADFAAKELFAHEKVRKQFLSDTLGIPLEDIKSVRLVNPFLRRRYKRQKQGILDVVLELNDNAKIDIEMQVRRQKHWTRRNLYYLAGMYTDGLMLGERYEKLPRVSASAFWTMTFSRAGKSTIPYTVSGTAKGKTSQTCGSYISLN